MSEITRVYLITGFLGSGKTTFLNRIIDAFPKDAPWSKAMKLT
jgi:uridine kinase